MEATKTAMICGNKNKPTLNGYWAQNGTEVVMDVELGPIVVRKAAWIEDHMSRECRFDQKTEEMCDGCERFNDQGNGPRQAQLAEGPR